MANGATISYDRDVASNQDDTTSTAYDTRARKRVDIPAGCAVADRHGDRWLDLCGSPLPTEVKLRRGAKSTTAFPPPSGIGHWRKAMFSPDGTHVLLQWSGECEMQTAYVGDPGRPLRQVPGPTPTADALGWSADGRAVVFVPTEPGCGTDDDRSGLHLVRADGTWVRVFGPSDGRQLVDASLWMRVPG
jgi:hypothetical protein